MAECNHVDQHARIHWCFGMLHRNMGTIMKLLSIVGAYSVFIYLLIYGLLNDALSSLEHVAWSGIVINK